MAREREILLPRVQRLIQYSSNIDKPALLSRLRTTPTDIDETRSLKTGEWKKGSIWFHSLQDTRFVDAFAELSSGRHHIIRSQACFTKDLDLYLSGMPPFEQHAREVLDAVYKAGTSFYWQENIPLFREFHKIYEEVANQIIEPWVKT